MPDDPQNQPEDSWPRAVFRAESPDATAALGAAIAPLLAAGDTVLLSGPLGAGKSHLARAIIRTCLGDPEAIVASPSYTLANVYEAGDLEIWHADLYRLTGDEDLLEIGLDEAAQTTLLLVEWPERWADKPPRFLDIELRPDGDHARVITIKPVGSGWDNIMACVEASQ